MQAIIDFFTGISDAVTNVISWFFDFISDIFEMTVMLGVATSQLPAVLSFLPSSVVTLLSSFLVAAVLYKILGREG